MPLPINRFTLRVFVQFVLPIFPGKETSTLEQLSTTNIFSVLTSRCCPYLDQLANNRAASDLSRDGIFFPMSSLGKNWNFNPCVVTVIIDDNAVVLSAWKPMRD